MTYKGQSLHELTGDGPEEAESCVLTSILSAQQHLQFLAAAYEEISAEQTRRLESARTVN